MFRQIKLWALLVCAAAFVLSSQISAFGQPDPAFQPSGGVTLSIYRTPVYSIAYPQPWNITARGAAEIYIGPGVAPICDQPGMLITLLGDQPPGTIADTLIDTYQKINTALTQVGERADLGNLGRTAIFDGACGDGTARRLRVSTFVAFGKGYRISEYAPKAAYSTWLEPFKIIAESFSPANIGAGGGAAMQPAAHASSALLLHVFGGNVYMANVADLPGAPITRDADGVHRSRVYSFPRIAPDGKRVVFIDAAAGGLYLASIAKNTALAKLPGLVAPGFPPAWSPDGSEIAFVAAGSPQTVQAIRVDKGTVRALGTLTYATCPIDATPDPAARVLGADMGSAAGANPHILEWLNPTQLLIARGCGSFGLDLLDTSTGTTRPLADLEGARLSPSRTTLAGLAGGKLTLFDLATQKPQLSTIDAAAVAWSADGNALFYATQTLTTPLKLDAPTAGFAPFTSGEFALTLHRYALSGAGGDTILYAGSGYAIGSIAVSPDGFGLLFTVIPSDAALLTALTNKADGATLGRSQPAAHLYWLPLIAGATPILLANTTQPRFGPVGSAAVIGVPVAPHPGATNIPGG